MYKIKTVGFDMKTYSTVVVGHGNYIKHAFHFL